MFNKRLKLKLNLRNKKECSIETSCLVLSNAFVGNDYKIISLKGCGKFRNKINGMGLYKNSIIKVLQNDKHYPIKIAIGNVRIALGRGIASKITVERIDENN